MKIKIDGHLIEGEAAEILDIIELYNGNKAMALKFTATALSQKNSVLGSNVKTKSDILRAKLAEDPGYSPYGGVVPSKEPIVEREDRRQFAAELDTGISYD